MDKIFFVITAILILIGCKQSKNELNHLSFKVSKDTMLDSLKTATELLNKMDYGNGATCFVVDGKLHHTRKDFGFTIVEMPKENASITPIIEPLDQSNSIRLFNLMHFMLQNGFIDGMGKRADGVFYFGYKQINLNPHNRYNDNRSIIYTIDDKDTLAKISDPQTILDRYKNILLVGPSNYNEPKLPTDEKSRKERAKDFLKKKENEGKKLKAQ